MEQRNGCRQLKGTGHLWMADTKVKSGAAGVWLVLVTRVRGL